MNPLIAEVLNQTSDAMSLISPTGHILFINEVFLQRIAESRDYLMNADLLSNSFAPKISNRIFDHVLEQKTPVRGDQLYKNELGEVFSVSYTETPVMENGELKAVLVRVDSLHPVAQPSLSKTFYIPAGDHEIPFVVESPAMREIVSRLERIAQIPVNILLTGESGVGKDAVASLIHYIGNKDNPHNPFVVVNCSAFPESLIESELFGYEKGAFTGAEKGGKKGLIEQADGGTLFLDEINSLPLSLQGKLLRVLETKLVRPVGSTNEKRVEFRLITASNRDLFAMVQNQQFREDLYYRINVFSENIPPLRERREEIIPLLSLFVEQFSIKYHTRYQLTQREFAEALNYNWPGNVRELRNYAEQFAVLGMGPVLHNKTILTTSSPQIVTPGPITSGTLKEQVSYFEKQIIYEALKTHLSKKEAAKELGIDPAVLSRKIAKYQLY